MTGANIDRHQRLQKTIVAIEFTVLDLCRVQNFIKIEAFAVPRPEILPEWWQVPTLAGVKNHRKLLYQWIQHLQIVDYAKFRGKWITSFPVPFFKDSLSDYNRFQDFKFQVFSNYNRCHILQEKFCMISMSNMEIKSKLGYFPVIYIGLL